MWIADPVAVMPMETVPQVGRIDMSRHVWANKPGLRRALTAKPVARPMSSTIARNISAVAGYRSQP